MAQNVILHKKKHDTNKLENGTFLGGICVDR